MSSASGISSRSSCPAPGSVSLLYPREASACRLLGDLEDATNPVAPECSTSGSSCGPALVVANGLADIGLGSDHLAGIRVGSHSLMDSFPVAPGSLTSTVGCSSSQVQSVLCGLSGFRPTQGQISGRGITQVTGSLDTVGWLVRDPALHPKIADALKLPGGCPSRLQAHTSATNSEPDSQEVQAVGLCL